MNTTTHINAGGSWDRALDDRVHLGRSQVADERVTIVSEVPASNFNPILGLRIQT